MLGLKIAAKIFLKCSTNDYFVCDQCDQMVRYFLILAIYITENLTNTKLSGSTLLIVKMHTMNEIISTAINCNKLRFTFES